MTLLALTLVLPAVWLAGLMLAPLAGRDRPGAGPGAGSRLRRLLAVTAPAALLPGVVLPLFQERAALDVPWLLLGARLEMDATARALLPATGLLYAAALASVAWVRRADRPDRGTALAGFLLASGLGNQLLYVAADTATFYVGFALMSLAAAGLVVHHRTAAAHRATGVYLVLSVLSETLVLGGLLLVVAEGGAAVADAPAAVAAGDLTGLTVALLVLGFGIKAGLVPLHVWLPLAHPAAPPAASAVMSGAMVNAGVVGWLRFLPSGAEPGADAGVLPLAGGLLVGAAPNAPTSEALVGVLQTDPKVVLAYSTVSQLGFVGAVVGAALRDPALAPAAAAAAVLYLLHHSLVKGALFLGVPVVAGHLTGARGVLVLGGLALAGLSLAGAPLTSGAIAKYAAKDAVYGAPAWGSTLDVLLPFVAAGSTLLLLRLAWLLARTERAPRRGPDGELGAWAALVAAALVAVPVWGVAWLEPLARPEWTDAGTLVDALWPIALGLVLGGAVWAVAAHRAGSVQGPAVPPGDLVVPAEGAWAALHDAGSRSVRSGSAVVDRVRRRVAAGAERVAGAVRDGVGRQEQGLAAWTGSGSAALMLSLAVMIVLGLVIVGGGLR